MRGIYLLIRLPTEGAMEARWEKSFFKKREWECPTLNVTEGLR